MKLTDALWRWKKALPKGNIWSGKYRLHKKITPEIFRRKIEELEMEEQNMFYLRHPYLTIAQSKGHAAPFNHKQKFLEKCREANLKWKDHKYIGDRFGFLKISEKWE